jgi:hypothetical protein
VVHVAKVVYPLTYPASRIPMHTYEHTHPHSHPHTHMHPKVSSLNILPDGRATLEATFTARHRLAGIYVEPDTQGLYYAIPGVELSDDLSALDVGSWTHGVLNEAVKVSVCIYLCVCVCVLSCTVMCTAPDMLHGLYHQCSLPHY